MEASSTTERPVDEDRDSFDTVYEDFTSNNTRGYSVSPTAICEGTFANPIKRNDAVTYLPADVEYLDKMLGKAVFDDTITELEDSIEEHVVESSSAVNVSRKSRRSSSAAMFAELSVGKTRRRLTGGSDGAADRFLLSRQVSTVLPAKSLPRDIAEMVEERKSNSPSPVKFLSSPPISTRRSPRLKIEKASPTLSERSLSSMGVSEIWDRRALLTLTDYVRGCLGHKNIPLKELDALDGLLDHLVDSCSGEAELATQPMEYDIIAATRFDKMLDDLMQKPVNHDYTAGLIDRFQGIERKATTLYLLWSDIYGRRYYRMDEEREKNMYNETLHSVTLDPGAREMGESWLISDMVQSATEKEDEENLKWEPGDWWLNMACALRDGIVGSTKEEPTRGKKGKAKAVPLLSGKEIFSPTSAAIKYVKEGPRSMIHTGLMLDIGRTVRILRGDDLDSRLRPSAGIRYDGLYKIEGWGYRLVDEDENTYRQTLDLVRIEGQKPLAELQLVPTPSQIDEWYMYLRMVGTDEERRAGSDGYRTWVNKEKNVKQHLRQQLQSRWSWSEHMSMERRMKTLQ